MTVSTSNIQRVISDCTIWFTNSLSETVDYRRSPDDTDVPETLRLDDHRYNTETHTIFFRKEGTCGSENVRTIVVFLQGKRGSSPLG